MRFVPDSCRRWLFSSLALACGLNAQGVRVEKPLLAQGNLEWLRPMQDVAGQKLSIVVLMPKRRWQYVRALRAISDLQSRFGKRVAIAGILQDGAHAMVGIHLRGSSPRAAMAIDADDHLRTLLGMPDAGRDLAHAVMLDHAGVMLWIGAVDPGLSLLIADYLTGRIDAHGLCRLLMLERELGFAVAEFECGHAMGMEDAADLLALSWQPWAARMRLIPDHAWAKEGLDLVAQAIKTLSGRREAIARVLRLALERSPELASRALLSSAVTKLFQRSDSAQIDLLGYVWHAARHEEPSARSRAIRYIDRLKGVPDRLVAFHRRLGDMQHGDLYVDQQLTALQLAALAEPTCANTLRALFDLLTGKLDAFPAAKRIGYALVSCRSADISFLNSFAWRLLTEEPFAGRMNRLALHAAQSMCKQDEWSNYWRLDTLALALFENGHTDEAIEVQTQAVEECEAGSRVRYTQRLERYRQAKISAVPGK